MTFALASSLRTTATRAAAVFDLDGTLVPNTGRLFAQRLYRQRPLEAIWGPFSVWSLKNFRGERSYLRYMEWLEPVSREPFYARQLDEFARDSLGQKIFRRGAEELAWHRANLHTIVLISGGVKLLAAPLLPRIQADHTLINERFWPSSFRRRNKPEMLRSLMKAQGLFPHAVMTDAYYDRHMLLDIEDWNEISVMEPDRRLRQMALQAGWTILSRDQPRDQLPVPCREYAGRVIRGEDLAAEQNVFYRKWSRAMLADHQGVVMTFRRSGTVADRAALRDFMAVAGLYLKEPESVRVSLESAVGRQFSELCLDLYAQLVKHNPTVTVPLNLLTAES